MGTHSWCLWHCLPLVLLWRLKLFLFIFFPFIPVSFLQIFKGMANTPLFSSLSTSCPGKFHPCLWPPNSYFWNVHSNQFSHVTKAPLVFLGTVGAHKATDQTNTSMIAFYWPAHELVPAGQVIDFSPGRTAKMKPVEKKTHRQLQFELARKERRLKTEACKRWRRKN